MKLWRHLKEKNMMQLFTWGVSGSTGRYNHQAHMVFHKFTYCMKHLEGNMQLIHLTQYKDFGDSILHQSQWQTKNLVIAETRLEQDQVIAGTRPKKQCKHHTQDIVTYSRQFHEIMKTFEREEHDAAFYMRSVRLNRKVQSSSSHGFSQIHLLHETPWRKCAIDSFDSVKDFGDSILHQSQWQTKNLVIAETRLEQDQVIVRTRPEKNCKHHTQDIVTYSRTISWNYEDIWKRRTWCSFLHEEMSDSTGRYNHQAHMVFHKFTWCMKHLEGNMHMIHLTL